MSAPASSIFGGVPSVSLGKGATPPASAAVVEPLRATLRECLLRRDAPRAAAAASLILSAVHAASDTPPPPTRALDEAADPARREAFAAAEREALGAYLELATTGTKTIFRANAAEETRARELARRSTTRGTRINEDALAELATSWVIASDDADRAAAELSRKERLAPGSRSATDGGRFASATPARRRFLALLAHGKWLRESGWGGEDEKKEEKTGGGGRGVSGVSGPSLESRGLGRYPPLTLPPLDAWWSGEKEGGGTRSARSARPVGVSDARVRRLAESAESALDASAADDPGDAVVAVARAQIRLALGDVVGAERTLAAAAKAAPGDADATMTYARFVEAMRRATEPESEESDASEESGGSASGGSASGGSAGGGSAGGGSQSTRGGSHNTRGGSASSSSTSGSSSSSEEESDDEDSGWAPLARARASRRAVGVRRRRRALRRASMRPVRRVARRRRLTSARRRGARDAAAGGT